MTRLLRLPLVLLIAFMFVFAFAPGCARKAAGPTNMEESVLPPPPPDPDSPAESSGY